MQRLLLITMLTLGIRSGWPARASDDLAALLQREWAILSAYDNSDKHYKVEVYLKLWQGPSRKHQGQNEFFESNSTREITISGGCCRVRTEPSIICWNKKYTFILRKYANADPDAWVLGHVIVAPPPENELKRSYLEYSLDATYIYPLTSFIGSKTCDQCLSEGSLQVADHQFIENDLVKVNIRFISPIGTPGVGRGRRLEKYSGHMIVDPKNHYVIREVSLATEQDEERNIQIQFTRTVGKIGDLLVANSVIQRTLDGLTFESVKYKDYQMKSTDASEFQLSYYGFPEPVGVEWERRTPVYVWLLLAAGVLGLLAVVLAWLAKRRRTTGES